MAATTDLQAGDLDRLLTLLTPAIIREASGERILNYDAAAQATPCKYEAGKGGEKDDKDRLIAAQPDSFTVRFREDITPTHRLLFEGNTYNVTGVREGAGRRQWTVISATKTDVLNPVI